MTNKTKTVSKDDYFRHWWNQFVILGKAQHAFELFRVLKEEEDPKFSSYPQALQLHMYKEHLKKLELIK